MGTKPLIPKADRAFFSAAAYLANPLFLKFFFSLSRWIFGSRSYHFLTSQDHLFSIRLKSSIFSEEYSSFGSTPFGDYTWFLCSFTLSHRSFGFFCLGFHSALHGGLFHALT